MPKSGSTSLKKYFLCNNISTSHWSCPSETNLGGTCGHCVRNAIKQNKSITDLCPYQAFMQLDNTSERSYCMIPQFTDFKWIDERHPGSKFVFMNREIKDWIESVKMNGHLFNRFLSCLNYLNFESHNETNERKLAYFYRHHLQIIKHYFKDRPNDFIVLELEAPFEENEKKLDDFFGFNSEENKCWGQSNHKKYNNNNNNNNNNNILNDE